MKYIYSAYESAISGKISYAKEYYENMPLGNLENKIISLMTDSKNHKTFQA